MADLPLPSLRPTLRLPSGRMAEVVDAYLRRSDAAGWNLYESFAWAEIDAGALDGEQQLAVEFITYIEDHIPGYFAEYALLFPLDEDVDRETWLHNRELYRFTVRWAQEEERHAHVLARYQRAAGIAEPQELADRLFEEGRKSFHLTHTEPVQVVTYTLVQEKATQLYYRALSRAVGEPVLKAILTRLARDEARHFAFFARLLEAYVQEFGSAVVAPVKEALQGFRMPLALTLKNYWRLALRVADAAGGYDHTEAYEDLLRVVERAAQSASWSRTNDLATFVDTVRRH